MCKLVKELTEYIHNASLEQLERDWEELKEYNNYGPIIKSFMTVITNNEYLNMQKLCNKGQHKVRENSLGICWCVRCGKLFSDAKQKLNVNESFYIK